MTGSMTRRSGGSYEITKGGKEKLITRTKDGNAPQPPLPVSETVTEFSPEQKTLPENPIKIKE